MIYPKDVGLTHQFIFIMDHSHQYGWKVYQNNNLKLDPFAFKIDIGSWADMFPPQATNFSVGGTFLQNPDSTVNAKCF